MSVQTTFWQHNHNVVLHPAFWKPACTSYTLYKCLFESDDQVSDTEKKQRQTKQQTLQK